MRCWQPAPHKTQYNYRKDLQEILTWSRRKAERRGKAYGTKTQETHLYLSGGRDRICQRVWIAVHRTGATTSARLLREETRLCVREAMDSCGCARGHLCHEV